MYLGTARRKGRQQTTRTYCHRVTSRLYQPNQLDCFAAAARGIGLGIVSLGARAYVFCRYHAPANRLHPVIN
jgi:hypothetical protein